MFLNIKFRLIGLVSLLLLGGGSFWVYSSKFEHQPPFVQTYDPQPLTMTGGDPHIRALMRTITASESNVDHPYHVLYGGEYVTDLSRHPNQCVPIVTGPNIGKCTTAAGRYQFLNTTWDEKAKQYHPNPSEFLWWKSYSFEPQYQDQVVYQWLSDRTAWGVDIPKLLKEGKIEEVLRLLSGTWTSLGYGIETNSISPHLAKIYQKMLSQEIADSGNNRILSGNFRIF